MQYEVELKFPLAACSDVLARLSRLGAVPESPIEQVDYYFNHPLRDFKKTDEAFRIRSVGEANCLTYKGPRIDLTTKMRQESEISFAGGSLAASQMFEIWQSLGFRRVGEVRKTRMPLTLDWHQRVYELAVDEVPPLGTFLEIELLADAVERDQTRTAILDLARELCLSNPEHRSYLELLQTR
ncbi:MAG: class IV adenylate cyclase [Planctomycetales bacterium]|nr:class IV adenylate cyclase [Planctomycetales bacterium]